jgi:hypothetical protein
MLSMLLSNDQIAKEVNDIVSAFKPTIHVRSGHPTVPCQLFNDRITDRLCQLRRKELDGKGEFTCIACLSYDQTLAANAVCRSGQ